jgi:phosphate transport system ATP-binding protein
MTEQDVETIETIPPPGDGGDEDAVSRPDEEEWPSDEPIVDDFEAEEPLGPNAMETVGLRVVFSGREALLGVDVPFVRGQVTAILGPSGCGKTTLLRSLNRLTELSPTASVHGRILLDGEDCLDMDPVLLRRRVGMVFQRPNPFPMSIRENVLYGVKAHGGGSPRGHKDIVEASLRKAVIWDEVKDRLGESALNLSGGQQQRICIARTLAVSPEVVLMDEPAASLDPASTLALEETIASLRGDYTVIFVTHDVPQARRVSDFMAFLYLGSLVEYGPTEQLFDSPRSESTRAYLAGGLIGLPEGGSLDGFVPQAAPMA